jgi:hypothetical protein
VDRISPFQQIALGALTAVSLARPLKSPSIGLCQPPAANPRELNPSSILVRGARLGPYCGAGIAGHRVALSRLMITRYILVALLVLAVSLGGSAWDKVPEKWDLADVYRILQDSPWSPAGTKLDPKITSRHTDPQTGRVTDAPVNSNNANPVPGLQISRSKSQPAVPVLWWSSKTIRLAQQRLHQLRQPALGAGQLRADDLLDYVLVIEGSEPLRILRDAKEDLHDTVFLDLPGGATIDLESVRFVDETEQEQAHVEFHFPRQLEGRATLDPESVRIVFHCKATAKTPRPGYDNALFLRAKFNPRAMRVHGVPDL